MVKLKKPTGRAVSISKGLALGGTVSMGITIAGAAIAAALMEKGAVKITSAGWWAMGILMIASVAGTQTSVRVVKHRALVTAMMAAAVYYALLLSCTALFFGGNYTGMGTTALTIFASTGISVMIGAKSAGIRKKKRPLKKIHC